MFPNRSLNCRSLTGGSGARDFIDEPYGEMTGCTFTSKKIREWDEIDCTELLLRLDPGHEQYLPRILVYLHFHLDGISLAHLSEKDLKNIGYHLKSPMSKSLARQINNVRDKLKSQSNIETEYEITFEKPHHLGLELGIKDASALIVEKVLDSVAIDIQNVQVQGGNNTNKRAELRNKNDGSQKTTQRR